jgi:hypothetical protein
MFYKFYRRKQRGRDFVVVGWDDVFLTLGCILMIINIALLWTHSGLVEASPKIKWFYSGWFGLLYQT